MRKYLLLLAISFLMSCSLLRKSSGETKIEAEKPAPAESVTPKEAPKEEPKKTEPAPAKPNVGQKPNNTPSKAQQGQQIFAGNCGKCHKLYKKEDFTSDRWTKIVDKMAPKAKLTEEQKSLVLAYLTS